MLARERDGDAMRRVDVATSSAALPLGCMAVGRLDAAAYQLRQKLKGDLSGTGGTAPFLLPGTLEIHP